MLDHPFAPFSAVILTALPVEYRAVRLHLTHLREDIHQEGTIYECGVFQTGEEIWNVGITQIGMGNSGAAAECERAIAHFHPQVVFFVGIAGGLKEVRLGDVVAATKVYGYESGKVTYAFLPRPEVGNATYLLEQRAKAEANKPDWLQRLRHQSGGLPEPTPRVLVGPIAAGEKVLASTRSLERKRLQAHFSDALAVEMEGIGFFKAIHANAHVSALIIRGISDLIDDKSEADAANSQEIAAQHASAFAFEILAKLSFGKRAQGAQPGAEPPPKARRAPTVPQRAGKFTTHIKGNIHNLSNVEGDHHQIQINQGDVQNN